MHTLGTSFLTSYLLLGPQTGLDLCILLVLGTQTAPGLYLL